MSYNTEYAVDRHIYAAIDDAIVRSRELGSREVTILVPTEFYAEACGVIDRRRCLPGVMYAHNNGFQHPYVLRVVVDDAEYLRRLATIPKPRSFDALKQIVFAG